MTPRPGGLRFATTCCVVASLVVVGGRGTASAQMGGGANLTVEVKPRSGPPRATAGSPVRVLGASFDENGRPVEIRWGDKDGHVLATAPVDRRGEFRRTVIVPADAAVGPHLVTATQKLIDDSDVNPGQLSIDVVATDAESTVVDQRSTTSASTDRDWRVPALTASSVVLVAGLVLARKRRRARAATG